MHLQVGSDVCLLVRFHDSILLDPIHFWCMERNSIIENEVLPMALFDYLSLYIPRQQITKHPSGVNWIRQKGSREQTFSILSIMPNN